MIFQQSDLNEDVEGEERVFGMVPLSPSSALRAPSPPREKGFLRFMKKWILQLRVNPSCRMTWGWGESGRRNQFIKICRYKRHDKIFSCSIISIWTTQKNQCCWHQSTTNACSHSSYCEQHQNQCAELLQAIHKASTSNERKINISALSININAESSNSQCTEHQQAKLSVFISKAHRVSVQCILRQQHWTQH